MKIAVFASHGGSDLQAIIDGCREKKIDGEVVVVISNNGGSLALKRAEKAGIDRFHLSAETEGSADALAERQLAVLEEYGTEMVFLAGYMKLLDPRILERYENRIFNIHPALLPKYGGKGMYDMHVHEAVLAAGEKETGVTIHRVSPKYDSGEIIAQTKVPVLPGDTPESLRERVLAREHEFLVEIISKIAEGKY
jgi:phosphoribosylglycinamide formyltransferase-1